jgi:hypothetical protein
MVAKRSPFTPNDMTRPSFYHLLFTCLLLVCGSGCFNIVEEITLRKNGSGTYRLTVSSKEMTKMIEGMKGLAEDPASEPEALPEGDRDVTDSITSDSTENTSPKANEFAMLRNIKGISNVVLIKEKETKSEGVSFDFENMTALKTVMDSLNNLKMVGQMGIGRNFSVSGKTLKRDNSQSMGDIIKMLLQDRSEGENKPNVAQSDAFMRMLFGSMSFTQVYHFPDRKIKKCNQKGATVSNEKHTLTIVEYPFKDSDSKQNQKVSTLEIKLK